MVREFVKAWQRAQARTPGLRVVVAGHAELSEVHADRISQGRAEAVATLLRLNGVPAERMRVVSLGSRRLLVPTADPKRDEPQNRRVELVMIDPPDPRSLHGFLEPSSGFIPLSR